MRNIVHVACRRIGVRTYEKNKPGHQMVSGLCFWGVRARYCRDCWYVRSLTAIDSSLLLAGT